VSNPALGGVTDNIQPWMELVGGSGSNVDFLRIQHRRYAAGSSWGTAEIRIQKHVDGSPMNFIAFRGTSTNGRQLVFGYDTADHMTISESGNLGIGTTNPQYKLAVEGAIGARDIVVTNTPWSDYVFQPGYRLRPLSEINAYIQQHRHLPDIPSEAEVKEKGVSVGEMQAKLLAKIEELTLHLIQQESSNRDLREQMARENKQLLQRIAQLEAHRK
jgi:hypothetical protein